MISRTNDFANHKSHSTFTKENTAKSLIRQENETIKTKLDRHEQILADIIRELKQKVNKSEFLSGLGSKISLSEITNLSFQSNNRDDSLRLDQSLFKISKDFQQKLASYKQNHEAQLQKIEFNLLQSQKYMKNQVQLLSKQQKSTQEYLKMLKQQNQGLLKIVQKKGDRSQLDKMMHLTSLLAIQFQLIKKRFSNFEVDYNLIWKEISNIYQAQEGIKTVLDTQQKLNSFNNTQQKQNKRPHNKRRNSACVTNLFKELIGSVQREPKTIDKFQEIEDKKLQKQLQNLRNQQQNINYSLKIFSDRLTLMQNKQQISQIAFKQLQKAKRQFQAAKDEIEVIYQDYRAWKDQTARSSNNILKEISINKGQIKSQIKHACQELSQRFLEVVEQYAKQEELKPLKQQIRLLQKKITQKTENLQSTSKKYQQDFTLKTDYLEEKIKMLQRELSLRMKESDFLTQKTLLISSKDAEGLMRKTENAFKKELQVFQKQQKQINQVLCSENVVARWIWISGELKGGNLVTWDKQVINTLPQNFNYLKNQYCIKVKNAGIYRFQLGFYAKKKPTIQILVNGQTVISAVNSNSYVVHHSSGRLKNISPAEVTGLTYYDFFTFQEDSRIAIAYNGDLGHGFISLQRL